MGTLLSVMVPEKRPEIMDRAYEYGRNRVLAGIHFRSDIEVARIAGALIALELMRSPEFRAEFELATAELRASIE
jgi:acid phosphatase (class A)